MWRQHWHTASWLRHPGPVAGERLRNRGKRFIAMNGGVTAGGDSGGPWYTGNYAVGVHKGTAYIGFGNRSVMTRVGNALSSLGLTLCTTSYCGTV